MLRICDEELLLVVSGNHVIPGTISSSDHLSLDYPGRLSSTCSYSFPLSPHIFPQRITGSQFRSRLQYFGQSLSGGQDLTMDGLMDLAVGAQGHALLLR